MIAPAQIAEIIALYEKHGWILRRVLLSPAVKMHIGEGSLKLFPDAEMVSADVDALWFSRSSKPGAETWELRHLSSEPFALVAVFGTDDDDETRRTICDRLVEKLKNSRK